MNACTDTLDARLAERASAPRPVPGAPVGPADGELDAHLAGCARCRAALAAYEAAFDLARAVPPAERDQAAEPQLAFDLGPALRAAAAARRWRRATFAVSGGLLATAAAAALLVVAPARRAHPAAGVTAAQPAVTASASPATTGYQPGVDEAVAAAAAFRGASASGTGSAGSASGDDDEVATALLEAYDDADLY